MIFDVHTHIYPDSLAARSVKAVGDFYGLSMSGGDGTVACLIEQADAAGVTKMLAHSVAITPRSVHHINDFIASAVRSHPDRLVGFGTLHPDMDDIGPELTRIERLGLRGVKLHPDSQAFPLDGKECFAMMERVAGRLPCLIHLGDKRYAYTNPARTKRLLEAFPSLFVIGAHLGGYSEWDEALELLPAHDNIAVDCSSSLAFMSPERARKQIRAFGAERVLFGSDYPMWTASDELKRLEAVGLTDDEMELILWKNAARLFALGERGE